MKTNNIDQIVGELEKLESQLFVNYPRLYKMFKESFHELYTKIPDSSNMYERIEYRMAVNMFLEAVIKSMIIENTRLQISN